MQGRVLTTFSKVVNTTNVLGYQVYGPYGNALSSSGSMGTAKGFTGQYHDPTGLNYYNACYYDPIVGLFISADTVQGNAQGVDPYAYVNGNPETMTDPTGHSDDPALYYVYRWYADLHPLDQTYADVSGLQLPSKINVIGPPDISNRTKHLVWEAKSGDYDITIVALSTEDGEIFGQYGTAKSDVASATKEALKQLPDTLKRLNSEVGSDLWTTGTLQNDPELAAFFDLYPGCATIGAESWCDIPFSDGTILSLRRPTSDGVLLYQATNIGGPRRVPIGVPLDAQAQVQAVIDAARANPPRMEPAG